MEGQASEQFNARTLASPLYGHDEVRFTVGKDGSLYIFVLAPAEGEISLPSLGLKSGYDAPAIKNLAMLGSDKPISFRQTDNELSFSVPAERPTRYVTVFKAMANEIASIKPRSQDYNSYLCKVLQSIRH